MKNDVIYRSYSGSDAAMIQHARVTLSLFKTDKQVFEEYDSDFADPFTTNWQAAIDSAETVANDSYYRSLLRESTKKVEGYMKESKSLMKELKYRLEKAYPGQKSTWARFGTDDYRKARGTQEKMVKVLRIAYRECTENSQKLIEKGLSQENIDRFNTLADDLANADVEQEKIKKMRPDLTADRIELLNACFAFAQKVHKAAGMLFANDPTKYSQYNLPGDSESVSSEQPAAGGE